MAILGTASPPIEGSHWQQVNSEGLTLRRWKLLGLMIVTSMITSILACLLSFVLLEKVGAQNLVLENDHLHIDLQQSYPYVEQYVLKSNGGVIHGDLVNADFHAYIFHQGAFHFIEPSVDGIAQGGDHVCYHMRTEIDSQVAVTFDLSYILSGSSVEVVFGNVQEVADYKLIHVRSPNLLTVKGIQPGAKLVFPYAEGRLIDIATTNPGEGVVELGNADWMHPLLTGMIYHNNLAAVCSYDHLDMTMYEHVFDHAQVGRYGTIGMYFNYRYPPSNFESAAFVEVFDEVTTSLNVDLAFLTDYDGDLDVDWMDGAKYLRDGVQVAPDPRYLSSFIIKLGRVGVQHISQHLENIEKLYHLTDHNKVHGYLNAYNSWVPFQVFGVEEDLDSDFASLEELRGVFQTADESYNTFLSFNDVYFDYYPGTPGYDPGLRVIEADGTPAQGWELPTHPEAFIADPYDYAIQEGLERIRRTLERYPIKESHHVDVLSLEFVKDHSPDSPSSRERNRRGVQLIIDEFNRHGVDVTSEALTGQYVESGIGWFLDTPRFLSTDLPFSNAVFIPLLEFIFHGKTLYGLYVEDMFYDQLPPAQILAYTFLEPLLLGANSASHITYTEPDDLELDKFYLIDLPWMALNERFMEDYEIEGSHQRITYDEDTFVEIDYENNTYTVQVDGRIIGENYTVYFPKDESTFLIFSREEKTISLTLPQEWIEGENYVIKLNKLTEEGVGDAISFQISGLSVTFNAEAETPYKLTSEEEAGGLSCRRSPGPQASGLGDLALLLGVVLVCFGLTRFKRK